MSQLSKSNSITTVYLQPSVRPIIKRTLLPVTGFLLTCVALAESAFITTQPKSLSVHPGTMVIFGVGTSSGAYSFQWQRDDEDIPGANEETLSIEAYTEKAGAYTVVVSDGQNHEKSKPATLTILESFGVALEHEFESWSSSFSSTGEGIQKVLSQENYWISQDKESFDGVDALAIKSRPNQLDATTLQATLNSPFTLKFRWKTDSPSRAILQFYVRDAVADETVAYAFKSDFGSDWEEVSATVLEPGSYRLAWIFASVYQPHEITAWLDQVEVKPLDAFEIWTMQNFSEGVRETLGDSLASTDSDYDGIPNMLEWAFFSDPNHPDSPLAYHIVKQDGKRFAEFSFTENRNLDGYEIVMESSDNLSEWTKTNPIVAPTESVENGTEKTLWRDPIDIDAKQRRFLRLGISVKE